METTSILFLFFTVRMYQQVNANERKLCELFQLRSRKRKKRGIIFKANTKRTRKIIHIAMHLFFSFSYEFYFVCNFIVLI